MLNIIVPEHEFYDEKTETFHTINTTKLQLEHSLLSLSKWESKWHKPYLTTDFSKQPEAFIDYIKCMTITKNVNPLVYLALTNKNIEEISRYIRDPHSATTFGKSDDKGSKSKEILTSEVIYYYMSQASIPYTCEKWHLNNLLTLLRVYAEEQKPPKKHSRNELLNKYAAMNKARRKPKIH